MSLIDTLRKDMFGAIKDGLKDESEILKMALASIKNAQIKLERIVKLRVSEQSKRL